MVLGGKRHKYVAGGRTDRSGIAVRKIDAAVGQAYVVDDVVDFIGRNLLSDRPLDLIAKIGGFLDAHSGRRAQMKFERAAVNAGEKVPAQPRNQNRERAKTTCKEQDQESTPVMQAKLQQTAIAVAKFLENFFKTLLKPNERIAACGTAFLLIAAQQVFGHSGNDSPGKKVRG